MRELLKALLTDGPDSLARELFGSHRELTKLLVLSWPKDAAGSGGHKSELWLRFSLWLVSYGWAGAGKGRMAVCGFARNRAQEPDEPGNLATGRATS